MFNRILNFRNFIAAMVVSIAFGGMNAQADPPKEKPPAAKTYDFTLENFEILRTRSRHNDTDHVSFALKVGDKIYPAKVKHMGDLNDGTFKVGLSFSGVTVPKPDTKIVLTYLVLNSGHKQDEVSKWLEKGATELLKKGATAAGAWGEVISYIGNIGIEFLFPNCDGWVAGDHITLTGQKVASYGASHKETREYQGLDSPTGCGRNSIYKVTWSVKQK
ncbi:hypothetical protein KIH39_08885 [Telmatocola sphagniphila]|jgi:hypothetical protein|uniref:Uncharacterized protein n=1 Tax=Telmatocola sphagniphila TaxID=1123043 RepID=A0A8E6B8T5_9BACT|nr:hypothetical protein [Telmatocola sphagniphila]QVL34003.1 hypothetical protein KIH39_08885 [Telmatocola sphagniphila]